MLEYNLGNIFKKKLFHFVYKVGNWNIFVETNVMYLCIQKHEYIPKNI
jgi:hypothetical protein